MEGAIQIDVWAEIGGVERFSFFLGFPSIFFHFQIENFKLLKLLHWIRLSFILVILGTTNNFGLKVPYWSLDSIALFLCPAFVRCAPVTSQNCLVDCFGLVSIEG